MARSRSHCRIGPCVVWLLFNRLLIDVAALFSLGLQIGRAAQVGLISKHNEKFSLLAVSGVFHHPRRDLVRRS